MAVVTTPAVLLRTHPYSETSLILRFFTEGMGTMGVMAKGARRRGSKGGSGLETFSGGELTVYVKEGRGLQTFKDFAPLSTRRVLARNMIRYGGASMAGELVLRHGGEAANPELFRALDGALDAIAEAPEEAILPILLTCLWTLVATLGYHPVLDSCVSCGRAIEPDDMARFDFGAGGVRCPACATGFNGPRVGPGARDQLSSLLSGAPVSVTRPRAHLRLVSDFITYHVSGTRELDSVRFLAPLLPDDEPEEATEGEVEA